MRIDSAIIHWVPQKEHASDLRLSAAAAIVFDQTFWVEKIQASIDNDYTRQIEDIPEKPSNVVAKARLLPTCSTDKFVQYSQDIAHLLLNAQDHHMISEGFLVVFRGQTDGGTFVCLLKLEGMRGNEAEFDNRRSAFEIRPIEKILLTQKTRVFKLAFFRFSGPHRMQMLAMDDQINRDEISTFWLTTFLGCRQPRKAEHLTKEFFDVVSAFSHSSRLSLEEGIKVRTALFVEMNSNSKTISPSRFSSAYVPATALEEFNRRIGKSDVPMRDFPKKVTPTLQRAISIRKFLLEDNITAIVPQAALDSKHFAELKYNRQHQGVLRIEARILKEK